MKTRILALVIALTAVSFLFLGISTSYADDITVTPARGNAANTFTFRGTGFVPGDTLDVTFFAPDGASFPDDQPVVIDRSGTFVYSIVPEDDLTGPDAAPGTWNYQFSSEYTSNVYYGTIFIGPS